MDELRSGGSYTDDDGPRRCRKQPSVYNTATKFSMAAHRQRDVPSTIRTQLHIAVQNRTFHMDHVLTASTRRLLINLSAHECPPSHGSFALLGSSPFNLYHEISFDKLDVLDLGNIRLFCDSMNAVLRKLTSMKLTRSMAIVKDRYSQLPPAARLCSHRPFRATAEGSQA